MPLRSFSLVLFLCAVNGLAQTQTAKVTPHQETVDEYFRRIKTDGAISTIKDDILALRKDVEAQKILIETLQKPSPTPHVLTDDDIAAFVKQRGIRNATESAVNAIKDDVYGLHLDLEADNAIIEKLQSEVKTLQTEVDALKSKSVKPPEAN
jgi:hypothetical protein